MLKGRMSLSNNTHSIFECINFKRIVFDGSDNGDEVGLIEDIK